MSLCSLSRSDRSATQASCSGTESLNVCSGDSLPLHSSSLKRHWWWWWQRANLCHQPVHSPLAISNSPRNSDHIADCFYVQPVLMFCPPDLERSEYNPLPSPRSARHCCFSLAATLRTCIWHSFCSTVLRISVSPAPSPRMAQFFVLASFHAIFQMASDHLDPSGTWTKCSPHVPPTTARSGSLLGVLLVCSSPHGT